MWGLGLLVVMCVGLVWLSSRVSDMEPDPIWNAGIAKGAKEAHPKRKGFLALMREARHWGTELGFRNLGERRVKWSKTLCDHRSGHHSMIVSAACTTSPPSWTA